MTNRESALVLLKEHIKNQNLLKHMLAVEVGMRAYASKFGEDAERLVEKEAGDPQGDNGEVEGVAQIELDGVEAEEVQADA